MLISLCTKPETKHYGLLEVNYKSCRRFILFTTKTLLAVIYLTKNSIRGLCSLLGWKTQYKVGWLLLLAFIVSVFSSWRQGGDSLPCGESLIEHVVSVILDGEVHLPRRLSDNDIPDVWSNDNRSRTVNPWYNNTLNMQFFMHFHFFECWLREFNLT